MLPTPAPIYKDLLEEAIAAAIEDNRDYSDWPKLRNATKDSDLTKVTEARHYAYSNYLESKSESNAKVRVYRLLYTLKQLLKQLLRRCKAKVAAANHFLKPNKQRIYYFYLTY